MSIEQRFRQLAAEWHQAVMYSSSSTDRNNHPAYQQIIALGLDVLPYLLRDLEENHTHWFFALRELTGVNPVPMELAGNIRKMEEAWLRWARENGYRW